MADGNLVTQFFRCPKLYSPVCAYGQTFANACEAKCKGQTDYTMGKCEDAQKPIKTTKPMMVDGSNCLALHQNRDGLVQVWSMVTTRSRKTDDRKYSASNVVVRVR